MSFYKNLSFLLIIFILIEEIILSKLEKNIQDLFMKLQKNQEFIHKR